MQILQPPRWPQPRGYSNGMAARGRLVFVAGQVGWDDQERFASSDLIVQIRRALENIAAVLKEAGASPRHVTRLTWYVTDMAHYRSRLEEIGAVYGEVFGRHFPAMACLEVGALFDEKAVVEIEATAVVP